MSASGFGRLVRRDPLWRVLWLARPLRGRLVLAVLAGAAATGCGVALLAVSGFLLARASLHPSILAISVAVVAVRGLYEFRSGDLLARLVSDVDTTQEVFLRGIAPPLTAFVVGAGAVTACLLILAPAAGVLAAGLLAAGALVPWLAAARARLAARRSAPARGEFTA